MKRLNMKKLSFDVKKLTVFVGVLLFTFVVSINKSVVNRVIAQDLIISCEYDYTKINSFDSSNNIVSSKGGEIVISPCDKLELGGYNAVFGTVISGYSGTFLKNNSAGDFFKISLPNYTDQATISIDAIMRLASQNISIDVVRNGLSVLPNGDAISLKNYYVASGSLGSVTIADNPSFKKVEFTVSGGGELTVRVVNNSGSPVCCVKNISVTATKSLETEFVPEYELSESGYLPKTLDSYKVDNNTYAFLGWINENYEIVDETALLPSGKYFSVYIYIEDLGGSIRKVAPAGIRLGFKIHYYGNIDGAMLVENSVISVYADFSVNDFSDSVIKKLDNYNTYDNALGYVILLQEVPESFYKTYVSSKIMINFGEKENVLESGVISKSIYDLASYCYNESSPLYNENYGYVYSITNNEGVEVFSQYNERERAFFKSIIDSVRE